MTARELAFKNKVLRLLKKRINMTFKLQKKYSNLIKERGIIDERI